MQTGKNLISGLYSSETLFLHLDRLQQFSLINDLDFINGSMHLCLFSSKQEGKKSCHIFYAYVEYEEIGYKK